MKRYPCEPVSDSFVDTAPARYVNSVRIDATPACIWKALEDASAWPRWATPIKNVEWTSPPPFGVGTTRTVMMIGKMTVFEEFIAWESNRRMSFRFNEASMNGVSAFAERYTLDVISAHATQVTWVMAMAPKGVSKLVVPVAHWPMQRAFGRMLRTFKALVEDEYVEAGASKG
jgi:hypothetical protein